MGRCRATLLHGGLEAIAGASEPLLEQLRAPTEASRKPPGELLRLPADVGRIGEGQLGGGRRGGGPNVGHQIRKGDVSLVPDGGDRGHRHRRERAAHGLVVERGEIQPVTAPTRQDTEIGVEAVDQPQGSDELLDGAVALDSGSGRFLDGSKSPSAASDAFTRSSRSCWSPSAAVGSSRCTRN
jgi:hypothetical protein